MGEEFFTATTNKQRLRIFGLLDFWIFCACYDMRTPFYDFYAFYDAHDMRDSRQIT